VINAHVEMNLNDHVVVVASVILEILRGSQGEMVVESLLKTFLKHNEDYTPNQFLEASVFLYSLGFVELEEYKISVKYV